MLRGGAGSDTVDYRNATGGITADLEAGRVTGLGTDQLENIENLTGSDYNDTISGNELDNILSGEGGDDILSGGNGDDTLLGGAGNDKR